MKLQEERSFFKSQVWGTLSWGLNWIKKFQDCGPNKLYPIIFTFLRQVRPPRFYYLMNAKDKIYLLATKWNFSTFFVLGASVWETHKVACPSPDPIRSSGRKTIQMQIDVQLNR